MSAADATGWETVIGLEVHCQLATAEKLFCGCPNRFGQPPNLDTCPICLGLPGVLPVLNRQAVDFALAVGAALGCTAHPQSVFARKHYFYPDLPKGYQITQYDRPLLTGGAVPVDAEDGSVRAVPLTRIHLEEDAGKSTHDATDATLVDLNRAGVPLIEIVGEPALRTPEEAGDYLRALRAIVRYLGVSDGNMDEGSFRCDANVSVRRRGATTLGTRTEIKNLNTFKGVQRAIAYEAARHVDLLEAGQSVTQETRLWDDAAGRTRGMRGKEEAHDYRYFPEPDLPVVELSAAELRAAAEGLPELPAARRARFVDALELTPYDAGVLTAERALADYFEAALAAHPSNAKGVCNWITSELLARVPAGDIATGPVAPVDLGRLVALIDDETISGRIAKQVFDHMLAGEGAPDAIIEARGLRQVTDTAAIEAACRAIIAEHPDQLAQFREGKTRVKGFFVGQVMKATRGKANPQQVNALLDRLLAEDASDP